MKSFLIVLLSLFTVTGSRANDPIKIGGFIPDFYNLKQTMIDNAYRKANINPNEGTAWASPENWKRKAAQDEVEIMMRNPMWLRYYLAPLWDKKYEYNINGKLSLIHYYDEDGKLLFTDHLIGTGSGNFQVTSMTGYTQGDRGLIHPGTYGGYQTIISNMTGITFMNDGINFPIPGVVVMSGTALYIGGNTNCTFTGTGSGDFIYGWQFTGTATDGAFSFSNTNIGCNFDHVWVHDMTNGPLILNNSLAGKFFDGVNSNTKLLVRCNFSFFLVHGHTGGIFGSFGGGFQNVVDSCALTHWTFDSSTVIELTQGGKLYRDTISYFYMGQIYPGSTSGDHGTFENTGNINYHHNIRIGQNWGWFSRNFYQSLNTPADVYIYSNINQGNISYGFFDTRTDTTGWGASGVGSPSLGNPKFKGCNTFFINNTTGNAKNTSHYVSPVFINYGIMLAGFHTYGLNNLRFNSNNTNDGYADSTNVFDFGTPNSSIVSQNFYFANPITSNILNDTTSTWSIKAGASIIGIGNPVYQSFAPTDYNGIAWGPTPDIGAVKFSSGPIAVAGNDQTLQAPVGFTTVNGNGSSDPFGTIVAYHWSQTSGPNTALFGTPNSVSTTISNLITGVYIFTLTVTDNNNLTASDQVQITILPAGSNLIQVQRMRVRTGP